jgi:hypothetical protein
MRVVEMRIGRSGFGEALGEMREWIDRVGAGPVKFESESDPNGFVVIRLEFSRDDLGFAFRRAWQVQAIDAEMAAA